jgi:trimeric autotransporter adhesin
MKTKLLLSALILLSPFSFLLSPCTAQVPPGFNYQAIARDGSGAIIANTALPVKIAIQTSTGTVIYEELFSSVATNQFGLISLVVGTGVWQSGSAATFSAIDWKSQTLYLKTTIQYPGVTWTVMGTSQIWGVPYSMVAKDVAGPISKLGITGTTDVMDEALFEVRNKKGNTVFAVYNEGIRAYVGDGSAKGVKGGFSVGGYDASKSGTVYDIFVLSTDSARFYLDSKPKTSKGVKGGFSVGGYDMTKDGILRDYLQVSKDSVRIYVDSNPATKGVKGGFSVGGYDMTKGGISTNYLDITPATTKIFTTDPVKGFSVGNISTGTAENYMKLNPSNYFIGHSSGNSITTGLYNSFLGYETGLMNSTGGYNTILGYQAGYKNNSDNNVFLGYRSGYNNSSGISNTFLGHLAGYQNSSGKNNVFLGDSAGYTNTSGLQNIFLGNGSGLTNNSDYNAFIGYQAGYKNSSGANNAFIGFQAGRSNLAGKNNIFIGYKAGYSNLGDGSVFYGNSNVYIGDKSGLSNKTGYSNVYIGQEAGMSTNSNTVSPPVFNVYIGYQSGYNDYEGTYNTFIGYQTGFTNASGNWNTFIGNQAGYYNSTGNANLFMGYQAGLNNTTGKYNVFNGYAAGRANTSGSRNTFIGLWAGYKNVSGNYNVSIGNNAGYWETGNRKLYISVAKGINLSQGIDSSLIYGEFDNQLIRLNKIVGIGLTPTLSSQALEVAGGARFTSMAGTGNRAVYVDATGIITLSTSDARLKENILPIENALDKVLALQGVTYSWKKDPEHLRYVGFVAQDVEKVIPELVFTDGTSGMKGIDYAEMSAVLAESVKAQQKLISEQQEEIKVLNKVNEENSRRMELLEEAVLKLQQENK